MYLVRFDEYLLSFNNKGTQQIRTIYIESLMIGSIRDTFFFNWRSSNMKTILYFEDCNCIFWNISKTGSRVGSKKNILSNELAAGVFDLKIEP